MPARLIATADLILRVWQLTFLPSLPMRSLRAVGPTRFRPPFLLSSLTVQIEEFMANTPQARKRIRRNERRTIVNRSRVSRIRTLIKKVESALGAGDKAAATEAMIAMQPELARGVAKGVVHKNTAARKFSRLTKRIASLG
jgi:small subunit ribosomal protein S20